MSNLIPSFCVNRAELTEEEVIILYYTCIGAGANPFQTLNSCIHWAGFIGVLDYEQDMEAYAFPEDFNVATSISFEKAMCMLTNLPSTKINTLVTYVEHCSEGTVKVDVGELRNLVTKFVTTIKDES